MLILDASRAGMILDCPKRAQHYRRNAVPRDLVQSAAQLVGEWTHAAWLLGTPPEKQPWPPRIPIRWDKTTPDRWAAMGQAVELTLKAQDLLDTVATARDSEHAEWPLQAELRGTSEASHVLVKARADTHWRHSDSTARIAELKTGQPRPSDVMQLAMTVAAMGEEQARLAQAWLLYVPRVRGIQEARGFTGAALYDLARDLADSWAAQEYPVPSHWCDGCPVEDCAVGRPVIIRPVLEDGLFS